MRTIIVWALGVPLTVFFVMCVLLGAVIKSKSLKNFGVTYWGKTCLFISGVKVKAVGLSNITMKTAIFAANHQGAFDIPVLQATLPLRFGWVAKRSLFNIPFFGWAMAAAGDIPIDRGSPKAMVRSIVKAAERIKAGSSVSIFPEGTRNEEETLLPFKKGAFLIALKSGVPVIPVSIIGTKKIMKKHSLKIFPGIVKVVIGEAIDTKDMKEAELMELVRERIEEGLKGE
ncbi:MAG: 1-acyl-sn-glycerol-3-phosphate acyltransferase [Deltaproteobacteria bacterium]|nr:1-acyl-sn-glycerol-3-phosphate acyltransferase [Deltaproteobacteria bacterium]